MKEEIKALNCLRCEYTWKPRKTNGRVKACPSCNSRVWDKEKPVKPKKVHEPYDGSW